MVSSSVLKTERRIGDMNGIPDIKELTKKATTIQYEHTITEGKIKDEEYYAAIYSRMIERLNLNKVSHIYIYIYYI